MTEETSEPSSEESSEREFVPTSEPTPGQTSGPPPPVRRRILWKLFLLFCVFSLIAFALLGWYVTTDSFQRMVRRRVVTSIEKITGGRVELGELHTTPFRLRVDARNLTIHGREAADQAPFLRVDRVQAELKIVSLLSTTVGLHSLVLDHPVVHVIDYPDGSTNVPSPQAKRLYQQAPLERLFSLAVSRVEVQRGELLWEEREIPLDFAARDLSLGLSYSLLRRQYEAHLAAASVATRFQQRPSLVWSADASLVLARGHADIASLTLASGKSEFHFAGRLQDFHNPEIAGDYHGVADLGELASLARQPQVRKGTVQFAGKGSWGLRDLPAHFSTQGTVQAKDLEWSNGKLAMRNGHISAAFDVAPDRFRLSSIKANLFGGDLAGEADVANWQISFEPSPSAAQNRVSGRVPPPNPQRGSVKLQLAAFPLHPVLEILSSAKLPLDRLDLSGSASGNVEMLWVGSIRDAETRLDLAIAPPLKLSPNEIPVHGQIAAVYRGSRDEDELEVSQLHLTTPGSEVTAVGNLTAASPSSSSSSSSSLLRFSFTSHNLKEWTPLLEAAYASPNLPFAVHGWASLAGSATGKLSALSVNGNLEVYDFDAILPAPARASSRLVHWDALSATLQCSSNRFALRNASLIHGHTMARFEASAALTAAAFQANDPFTLHFDLRNADAAELAQLLGASRSFAGTLNLSATVSGTRANPHGDGHLDLYNGMAYGVSVPLLQSDLRLSDGQLQFNNIEARAYNAQLSGSAVVGTSIFGALNLNTTNLSTTASDFSKNEFRLALSGRNLDLARLPHLQSGRFTADGIADFTLRASGTPNRPSIEAHIHLKDLTLDKDKERAGDFYIDAVTRGRELDLAAHSDFDNAGLTMTGSVGLQPDLPADLDLAFHHLDADALLRAYLPGKITGHSALDGTLHIRGPMRTPRNLKAAAEIQSFSAEVERVQIHSAEPIRLEITDQTLLLENFHLAGSGTDFTAHGRVHFAAAKEIDLRLDGSVNLALAQSLNPKILARGALGISLDAGGTLAEPVLQGRLDVKDAALSHNDFPSGLSGLNGVLLFDRDHIQIEKLSGATGGGSVALTGSATYRSGALLFDLGATARDVRLRYPPGVSSTANADVRLTGNSSSALLSGNIVVTKLAVTPGFDFAAYIEKSKQEVVLTASDSLESRLKLDVHVSTTPELQMQTATARLSGDADLRVRGTADRPAILGRAEVLEGEISFNGNKYKIERGDVTFANPAKTQPVIDLQASTRVRDYDITVQFRGDASVPNGLKITWQSEPQLPEADVIALLALGRTREESAAAGSTGSFGLGGDASNLLINQALNSTVNSRLQRLFGASRVKIDPQGLASETAIVRGPQVTVEQQVASNLTLTYSTNVEVSNQQIIQVEYNVTRNISIVALRDQNGVVSFDFKIRRRKK